MSGKGDRNRVSDWVSFYDGYNNIFRPKEPFYGGSLDSIQEDTSEDVGANPTSSTIEKQTFPTPPIRHGIRKIIE